VFGVVATLVAGALLVVSGIAVLLAIAAQLELLPPPARRGDDGTDAPEGVGAGDSAARYCAHRR
jgi:hypothetical protein